MADGTGNVYDPSSLVQQLVAMSSAPDQQALMHQRMQYGREDWKAPTPEGYRVGGTYMAASPLEHIASALTRGLGLAQQQRAMSGMEQSIAGQQAGRNAYAEALIRLLNQQQPQGPYEGEVPQLVSIPSPASTVPGV